MNLILNHPIVSLLTVVSLVRLVVGITGGSRSVKTTVITPPKKAPMPPEPDASLQERATYALGELSTGLVMASANSPEKQLRLLDLHIDRWLDDPRDLNHGSEIVIFCDRTPAPVWLPHIFDRLEAEPAQIAPLFDSILRHFDAGRVRYWFAADALGSRLNVPLVKRVVEWRRLEGSALAAAGARLCRLFQSTGCHVKLSEPDDQGGWERWVAEGRW